MAKGFVKAAGKASLDMPMAALAAASVAFVTFAMPDPVFFELVSASGLPNLLPAAEPPLGQTARLIAVALAGAGAFLLVWLILRALGQKPLQATQAEAAPEPSLRKRSFEMPAEPPVEAPRIRRADAHPDAPSRRPLFAGSDLGEPLDEIDVSDEPAADWFDSESGEDEWPEPLPGFIASEAAPADPFAFEAEAGEQAEPNAPEWPDADPIEVAPAESSPVAAKSFEAELEADEDSAELSQFSAIEPVQTATHPEAVSDPELEYVDDWGLAETEEASALPEPEEVTAQPQPTESRVQPASAPRPMDREEASIAELMQRLERGLVRCEQTVSDSAPEGQDADDEPRAVPELRQSGSVSLPPPVDDRLRNALDDLQKMVSRSAQG